MRKFLLLFFMTIFIVGCSSEPPVSVPMEKVLSADDSLTLIHEGIISTSNEIKIFSPVSGNVMEKYIEDNSDVSERQRLFKIDGLGPYSDYLQAKRELAQAMTALSKALVENDRSAHELQREVEDKQALVQKLEDEAAIGIIYAPKSGRLAQVAPLGMPVVENETLLATIGNINPVVFVCELSEFEKKILSTSDNLSISLKLSDGMTYSYEGEFNNNEIIFENPDEILRSGMTAQVEIAGIKIPNALLVPENSIQQNASENFVYINKNGEVAIRKIQLGDKLGTYFIVKDGLKADDLIITDGFKNLREGTPLKSN